MNAHEASPRAVSSIEELAEYIGSGSPEEIERLTAQFQEQPNCDDDYGPCIRCLRCLKIARERNAEHRNKLDQEHSRKLRFAAAQAIVQEYRHVGAEQRTAQDANYPQRLFDVMHQRFTTETGADLIREARRSEDISNGMAIVDEAVRDIGDIIASIRPHTKTAIEIYEAVLENMEKIRSLAGQSEESLSGMLRKGLPVSATQTADHQTSLHLDVPDPKPSRNNRGCPFRDKDVFAEMVKACALRVLYYDKRGDYPELAAQLQQKYARLGAHAIDAGIQE